MTFTAKEDYGLRAALVLAGAYETDSDRPAQRPFQARDIASTQQIPEPFLEQVLATLRRAGLVNATRGASGGYELARPPDQITAADILRALSGPLVPLKLIEPSSQEVTTEDIVVRGSVWRAVDRSLSGTLEQVTLKQLVEKARASAQHDPYGMHI